MAKLPNLPSPCLGVCTMDPATGRCAGCMRTAKEITIWPAADNETRYAILQELKQRRRDAGLTSSADMRTRRRERRARRSGVA